MKCFYHSADLDGHCSGAIVKYARPECEMIGIDYGDPFPWDKIVPDEEIYMVDFSLQPFSDMVRLDKVARLTWIDHHKSAIEEYMATPCTIRGVRATSLAACELAWSYLFPDDDGPLPAAVRLLGRYDVWDHSNPEVLPFQYGMKGEKTEPGESAGFWGQLFHGQLIDRIIGRGQAILDYQAAQSKKYVQACSFETEIDGLKCVAVNLMLTNSQIFDSVWDDSRYDAMLAFGWKRDKWTVSLYTDKPGVDVSVVAKARGGGGHEGAAGFQCSILPFLLNANQGEDSDTNNRKTESLGS